MKQPPWTLLMPLRCFFSTRKAQRICPSSSIRCQNGPVWVSKLSRLQVRQPSNSPSVPTCRSGRLRNADLVRSSTRFGLHLSDSVLKSDPHPMCKPPRTPKALDSRKLRHKRPFPALPISLIRDLNRARSLMNQPQITPELVASHGLKPDEYERILKLIGRVPSFTELGIFSAMWNEHCSYKSSRLHLRGLPTKAPWVIQGPGENAGVIDSGDGHSFGVPTVGGQVRVHTRYDGNMLVNAMAVGLAETDKIFYAAASGLNMPIVYLGSKTGRDGMHGSSMASAEFDEDSAEKRATVQVGDPFAEKLLLEACLEIMEADCVIAIQDMGAAGLTCSAVEMGAKGDLGVDLNLDAVPTRETGMSAYEMMLSESQERMLMVLKPEKEKEAEAIFRKWGLDFAIVGYTTPSKRFVVKHGGQVTADLPIKELGDEAPVYDRPHVASPPQPVIQAREVKPPIGISQALEQLIATPELCSKRWVWEQYDHVILGNTLQRPGGDAAVVRVQDGPKGPARTGDVTPRYCEADPYQGGMQAVAEAWRNITAVGGRPLAITDNLNFGNPERPEIMGQFVGCLKGISEACRALDFPVVSGNVSLYNETNGRGILPTPSIGGVGLLDDFTKSATLAFKAAGQAILLIGDTAGWLGQSMYLREVCGREEGAPPPVDLASERRNGDLVRMLIRDGALTAVHDVSDGGLLVALAEMGIAGGIGARLEG